MNELLYKKITKSKEDKKKAPKWYKITRRSTISISNILVDLRSLHMKSSTH